MQVTLIASNAKTIADSFESNTIQIFESTAELKTKVEHTTLVSDLTIVIDNILGNLETRNLNKIYLRQSFDHPLFKTKKLVFLVKKDNEENVAFFEGLIQLLDNTCQKEVKILPKILIDNVEQVISEAAPYTSEDEEVTHSILVKHRRGAMHIATNEIEELKTSSTKTIMVELSTSNDQIVNSKLPYQKNERTLQGTEVSEEEELEPLEDIILNLIVEEDVKKERAKVFIVTGRDCVSTTAVTLARSSIEFGKTLFIDADYETLGASYIIQQRDDEFTDENTEVIKLQDIIDSGNLVALKAKSISPKRLQILKLSLKVVEQLGLKEFEGCLVQLLAFLKPNYSNIIIDLPHRLLTKYTYLFQKADALIEVVPPYKNKFIPALLELSKIPTVEQYVAQNKLIIYRAGIPNTNKLQAFSYQIMRPHVKKFFNADLPITQIYQHTGSYIMPSDFKQIHDKLFLGGAN